MSGRGYNGEDDIGTNNNYYLYIGYWFRTMSSLEFNNRIIADIIGISSNGNPQFNWAQHLGGVQFIELCCLLLICRGEIDKENLGTNKNYYLYNDKVYRNISSIAVWSDASASTSFVNNDGSIKGNNVNIAGGVHIFRIMLFV